MAKPLDEDFNDIPVLREPKTVKGGVYSPADAKLIKDALLHYARLDIDDKTQLQIANLVHRLNNRT